MTPHLPTEPFKSGKPVKLLLKVNLLLLIVFVAALFVSYHIAKDMLIANAQEEIQDNARIMMESALAVRNYTSSQVAPLLSTQLKYEFVPQSVPSYSATEYFQMLRKSRPDYTYKEATLNPTNPRDRAVDWEVDVVNRFRQNTDLHESMGVWNGGTGKALYLARPLRVKDQACLNCHSAVDKAPLTMLDHYGNANGFGWNLDEVVGAQIVSVPYELPLKRATNALHGFIALLTGSFVFLFITVNAFMYGIVVRPVMKLAKIVERVSLGEKQVPEVRSHAHDEIGSLTMAFNRMRRSLDESISMLMEHVQGSADPPIAP